MIDFSNLERSNTVFDIDEGIYVVAESDVASKWSGSDGHYEQCISYKKWAHVKKVRNRDFLFLEKSGSELVVFYSCKRIVLVRTFLLNPPDITLQMLANGEAFTSIEEELSVEWIFPELAIFQAIHGWSDPERKAEFEMKIIPGRFRVRTFKANIVDEPLEEPNGFRPYEKICDEVIIHEICHQNSCSQ